MAFIYLASPYTSPDPDLVESRFLAAERYVANYLSTDVWVYSPIVHCHELAKRHSLPKDFDFWIQYNFAMLEKAGALFVLQLPGWETSKGVSAEIEFARKRHIPIQYVPFEAEIT